MSRGHTSPCAHLLWLAVLSRKSNEILGHRLRACASTRGLKKFRVKEVSGRLWGARCTGISNKSLFSVQARQNRRPFRSYCVKLVRIESENLQDRRSHLRGLHKACVRPRA